MKAVGQKTTPERDEFVLLSDVMGLSSLVDMIHNNKRTAGGADDEKDIQNKEDRVSTLEPVQKRTKTFARTPTSSSVLGPFHLANPPKLKMGSDLKRDNEGELVLVQGNIVDSTTGKPIMGASVNVWQTATNGLYSSQDPKQDTYNFHGLLASTGEDGLYSFTTAKPVPYQIPTDGPVGDLLSALQRHAWRPSHLHFIVKAEGYHPLVTELFPNDDPYLDGDAVFGVRDDLVLTYRKETADVFPAKGFDLSGQVKDDFWKVDFDLVLTPA